MTQALTGLRVIDFTQNVSGPVATMLLGDFGADIIKVEPPKGDVMRQTGETHVAGEAAYFFSVNRNKRSITVDLGTPEGRELARALVSQADVVFENFRPGVAERLGIGYQEVRVLNPRVIYCSTSAFGREGKHAHRPGMDPVVQAMAGVMQLTGSPATGPLKTGLAIADVITPLLTLYGVMLALHVRHQSGVGQRVDVAMLDASVFSMMPREAYYFATGKEPERMGNAHYEIVPYNSYRTSDNRYLMIIAHNDKYWEKLIDALGADELKTDARLANKSGRYRHRDVVDHGLSQAFAKHSLAQWQELLTEAGVMFAPVRTFDEVFNDARIRDELLIEVDHPKAGKVTLVGNPIQLSETPVNVFRAPPMLGEHNEEIIAELGLCSEWLDYQAARGNA